MARRQISGARILLTGASSGIGQALARRLAARGARLLLTARRADRLAALCRELDEQGGEARFVAGDISDRGVRAQLVDAARQRWQALDVLVNNAGIGALGPLAAADEARLRRIMEVNFFAPVELTRQVVPLLRAGHRPLIVNVGSVLGHRAVPGKAEYCASKFALHGISDAWRAELAADGIDLLLVSPSTTASEFFEQVLSGRRPAGRRRGMQPERVAQRIETAMKAGRHEIILSWGGWGLVWLDRLAPTFTNRLLARFG